MKMQVLESIVGEEVTVFSLDREETETSGELLDLGDYGVSIKYDSHGRQFIDTIPWQNINSISHKVLDAK